jgi:hypothetical protein
MRRFAFGMFFALVASVCAYSQSVISAHSGVIHYVEGRVLLAGAPVEPKFGQFPEVKNGQELETREGRAEILLTPGVFLRLGENSSVRMISNRLTDTKVEVLTGAALVECAEVLKDNAISLQFGDAEMLLLKHGLYRVDAEPARFRVFDGEAVVRNGSGQVTLKRGHETMLNGVLAANKFDPKEGDELYRWASRRSEYLSVANVSAANTLRSSGAGWSTGGWQFNPWFGMYTFVPYSGIAYSPFGYGFWSPGAVYYYYPNYVSGGGGGGGSRGSGGRVFDSGSNAGGFSSTGRSGSSGAFSGGAGRGSSGGGAVSHSGGGFGGHSSSGHR